MKKKLQLLFSLVAFLCVGITANAQEFATGEYYLQNKKTGLYWGASCHYGTEASLVAHPDYVTLVSNDDGTYKMESQVSNGSGKYYFNGSYMDSNEPVALTITKSGDYYTFSSTDGDGTTTYYGAPAAGTAATFDGTTVLGTPAGDSEEALWEILSAAEMKATLATATEFAPVDATFLITDHSFGRNHRYTSAWTNEGGATLTGGNSQKHCAEKYHGTFNVYQKLAGAPAGVYKFTAQGFYRQDGSDNSHLPVFYANEGTSPFPFRTGTENSMADACASFEAGLYVATPIVVQVTEEGNLTVGAKLEANTNLWCIWDHFVLKYYGADADLKIVNLIVSVDDLRAKAAEQKNKAGVSPKTAEALEAALAGSENLEESEAAYNAAIAALTKAIDQAELDIKNKTAIDAMYDLLESTNVYTTEAYETYKAKADEYLAKYNDGTLTETVVNPSSRQEWHTANDYDDLLLSAWTIGGEQCKDYDKALYINNWSFEGENDGTNFKVPFFEYFTDNSASLGATTLTATVEGLTPDTYQRVTAWVRNQPKSGVEAADVTGITLQVNNGEAVDVTEGEVKGGFNIGEFSAVGRVGKDGKLLIKINVAEDNNSHWLSFKNVKSEEVALVEPSSCIVNAEFDPAAEPLGWTANVSGSYRDYGMGKIGQYLVHSHANISPATVDETHLETEYCAGFECRWDTNFASYTQTTGILPPGNYTLTYDVENTNKATQSANYNNLFTVKVGNHVYTDNSTEWMEGQSSWTSHSIPFTITTPNSITISLGYGTGSNNLVDAVTPALYVSHLKLSNYTLEDAQADANAELDALAPIGDELFMYAQADIDAAREAIDAATTVEEVNAVARPTQNTPDPTKQYALQLGGTSFYMNLTTDGIKIQKEATPLSFVETQAGQYNLVAEGELCVGLAGNNTWTMSTAANKKAAWSFTALGNGEYHINNLVTVNCFLGTDKTDEGSTCYANKTNSDRNIVWMIKETSTATMDVKAGKWGTFVAPFEVNVPEGIKAYKVTGVENEQIVKEEVTETIPANTPVVLLNETEENIEKSLAGAGVPESETVKEGLLTGIYQAGADIPADSYVLQTQNDKQAFYHAKEGFAGQGVANRCYLTMPVGNAPLRAIFLGSEEGTTGIEAAETAEDENAALYNLAGQKVDASYKGIVIKKGKAMLKK